MIFFESEFLYACESCGEDDFSRRVETIYDPIPETCYSVYVCTYCGQEHTQKRNEYLLTGVQS